MPFNEDEYWILYNQSPEKGFKLLYDYYHKIILGFCLNNGQSHDDAEEVVQEVFFKFWKSKENIKRQQTVHSYLFKIARNVIVDKYRRLVQEKAAKEYQYFFLSNSQDTENHLAYNELKEEIERTFNKMPEIQRMVFQLSRFKAYSNKEIAKELGITVKTVEGHISKALKTFRKELGEASALILVIFQLF